jgi:hypothetical protein
LLLQRTPDGHGTLFGYTGCQAPSVKSVKHDGGDNRAGRLDWPVCARVPYGTAYRDTFARRVANARGASDCALAPLAGRGQDNLPTRDDRVRGTRQERRRRKMPLTQSPFAERPSCPLPARAGRGRNSSQLEP